VVSSLFEEVIIIAFFPVLQNYYLKYFEVIVNILLFRFDGERDWERKREKERFKVNNNKVNQTWGRKLNRPRI
jgi:hypothetical protein